MMVEGPSSKSLNVLAPNTTTSFYTITTTTTTTTFYNTHFLDYTIKKCFMHLISVTMHIFMLSITPEKTQRRVHQERVKPALLSKSNRLDHALSGVLQGQVSSFMNISQLLASVLNSLCYNLRFELHTS